MSKRYFISHASMDKSVALEIRARLDGDAWVDLHELDLGDVLLDEISTGIENASDFVLLWSAASAVSKWVRFEFHMAFIRWLEDNAVAIRVVCLDDTSVPLYLRPFVQSRGRVTSIEIVDALLGSMPPPVARRVFFNRNSEIAQIEEALYSPTQLATFVCGVPGSGKRSLAREALNRLTVGSGASLRITVTPGTAEPELNLLVANALGVAPADEKSPRETVIEHTTSSLATFMRNGGIWVFEDAEHWLNDDGTLGRVCLQIIEAAASLGDQFSRLVVFTSRRRPSLQQWGDRVGTFFLAGLAHQYAVPLLRAQGASGDDAALASVAEELDGHPLALEVVAPRLPMDMADLREQRHAIATDLVDPTVVSPSAWRLLEVLALVDGPIAGEQLASFLGLSAEGIQDAIAQAVQYSLVSNRSGGMLALHPLLRDYFLRSFRKQQDPLERISALADIMREKLETLAPGDALYVPSLLATVKLLGLAGRFDEARGLRSGLIGTLHQTAIELYQQKRYSEALLYIDEALSGWDENDVELLRLRIKTLAYLGQFDEARSLGSKLMASHPASPSVIRDCGRVEFIARDWVAAIRYFERAIPHRHNPAQLWTDIAQARMRLDDWDGAAVAAQAAIDRGGDTPWTLALYSEALEHLGRVQDAEEVMQRAVTREPKNPAYRHRLGRIAQLTGHRDLAIQQFRKSVELDPAFVQSWLSLASVLADDGDLVGAQAALLSGRELPGAPAAVVDNVQAKIHLGTGNLDEAYRSIEAALTSRRDGQNLALAVRVWIARAEDGRVTPGQAGAQVTALSRELDTLGQLRYVLDISRDFPQYFGK
ncbi:tetratricopeptide repeat protein [Kribbella sp. NPDC055110]